MCACMNSLHVCLLIVSMYYLNMCSSMYMFEGGLSILMDCQCFISKMKSYLCCHQSPKRGRLKVHLGPYLISVIENNPNKNLIFSMSSKQEFRQSKRRKRKRDPQIRVNSNEGSLKEFKGI
jgi:hypothetical protein